MKNPWSALPQSPPYWLPEDRPYIEAWNQRRPDAFRLRGEALPEPFVGRRDAPVVVLQRNPAWRDDDQPHPPDLDSAVRGNLTDDPELHIHPGFLERFPNSASWWRPRWRWVQRESGLSWEELARRVLVVESHGYYSKRWATFPFTLPSQRYSYRLVEEAITRGAVVLVMRGERDWEAAVPSLASHGRRFRVRSWQSAYVSPQNLGEDGFRQVLEALARRCH
jgi:hypothetical protein